MWQRLTRTARDDDGVTLVELLVTMLVMGILGGVVLAAVISTTHLLRTDDSESRGLADVRTVAERLARDVRDARSVDLTSATASQLTLWVDYNSDYRQQANETVTWHLVTGTSGHYNVVRSVSGSPDFVEARTLVNNLAFCYYTTGDVPCVTTPSTASAPIRLVDVTMTYQAIDTTQHNRSVTFQTRLRNVA